MKHISEEDLVLYHYGEGQAETVGPHLATVDHAYSHFKITLVAHHCALISGTPSPQAAVELRWVAPDELAAFAFPRANGRLLEVFPDASPFG